MEYNTQVWENMGKIWYDELMEKKRQKEQERRQKEQEEKEKEERNKKADTLNDLKQVGVGINLDEKDAYVHSTMAEELPQFVMIQTSQKDNRYLHLYQENPNLPNALRFIGDYSFELETRFEVEPATKGTGLIHLRCLRNNKYWANFGTGNNWVCAMADKPEENQSDKHCTLFQPVFLYSNNNRLLRLRHVQTGLFVTFFHGSRSSFALLSLMPGEDLGYDVCTFIDWKSVVVLPNLLRIKGDNGKHLKAVKDGPMEFGQEDDSGFFDFKAIPSRDGGIRLESARYASMFLTEMAAKDIWVFLKSADTTVHETNTVFLPRVINGGNRIILRSLKTGMYCNRYTLQDKENLLATRLTYPDEWSFMEIENPLQSRNIDNLVYHYADARRYNESVVALFTDDSSNRTQFQLSCQFNLKITVADSNTWSAGDTTKSSSKTTISAGVPVLSSNGYETSHEETKSNSWGTTDTENLEVGFVSSIEVPPMSRVKTSWRATRLSYDIPFSYRQSDTLKDGTQHVIDRHDGVYTCHTGYNYYRDDESLPLEPLPLEPLPLYHQPKISQPS